jgi:hypothetical protein
MLGLLTGRPGAKAFRQLLSLEAQRGLPVDELFRRARELVTQDASRKASMDIESPA